jgi:hypothetical protein
MEITEETRHRLYQRLEEVLEPEEATTLMAHLPPVGWADVATKHDLRALEERLDLRFESIDQRFDAIDQRFESLEERLDLRFESIDLRFESIDLRFDSTGQRIGSLEERLALRIDASESRVRAELQRDLRLQGFALLAGLSAVNAAALAIAQLL